MTELYWLLHGTREQRLWAEHRLYLRTVLDCSSFVSSSGALLTDDQIVVTIRALSSTPPRARGQM